MIYININKLHILTSVFLQISMYLTILKKICQKYWSMYKTMQQKNNKVINLSFKISTSINIGSALGAIALCSIGTLIFWRKKPIDSQQNHCNKVYSLVYTMPTYCRVIRFRKGSIFGDFVNTPSHKFQSTTNYTIYWM